jgi:hypothetical protein
VLVQELVGAASFGVRVIPLDGQRAQAALRVGERLAHHCHTLVDLDGGDHAGLGQGRLVIDRSDRRTEAGRVQHDGGHHPGEDPVDRETGPAEDLRGRVHAKQPRAPDERVVRRILEPELLEYGHPFGRHGQLAERRLPAVAVTQHAAGDLDSGRRDPPGLGGGSDQARSRLRRRLPVADPEALHRIGSPRELERSTDFRVPVHVAVRSRAVWRR